MLYIAQMQYSLTSHSEKIMCVYVCVSLLKESIDLSFDYFLLL